MFENRISKKREPRFFMNMKKILLCIFLIISTAKLTAQTEAEKNLGSWYFIYATHKISDHWSVLTGLEERNYEALKNFNLLLYHGAVNYKLFNNLTTTVGFMYLDIDRTFAPDADPNLKERRYYEQLFFKSTILKHPFDHRIRLEHRHLNSMGNTKVIHRIRYRFRTKINLNNTFYLTASNESFFNFKGDLYQENRFITAIGLKATKNIVLEAGYLGHYINNLHLDRLQVGIYINTDLRKKATN